MTEALAAQSAAASRPSSSVPLTTPPNALGRSSAHTPGTLTPAPRVVPTPTSVSRRPPLLIALLFFPFSMLWRVGNGFLSLFYTLFPFLARFRPTSASSRARARRSQTPRDTAARFIRLFEEEYGAATGLDFFEGGYAQALEIAKKDLRFLLVVLQSDEHDDTTSFNRDTLTHVDVVHFLKDQNIVLWAGSVQDSEAYQVATALQCTKFPFAALIALTPTSPSASTQAMSVVSRTTGPTPPAVLITKLTAAITAHSESLSRLRAQRAVHEADREIRAQQNSAYELSLARDQERARQRKEEAEQIAREEAAVREAVAAAGLVESNKAAWKRWRASTLPEEPAHGPDTVRVSIRTGDGERIVRRFAGDAEMEQVYAFVECLDVELDEKGRVQGRAEKPSEYEHVWGFRLVSPMPRRVFESVEGTVKACLWPSANLVVEAVGDDDEEE